MPYQLTESPAETTPKAFYRPKSACAYLDIGRTKLYELMEYDANFPRPIRLSSRCIGWTRGQLDTWLDEKLAEVQA